MNKIQDFIKHNQILNRSNNTIKAYVSDIRQFVDFICDKESEMKNITTLHIRHYLSYLWLKDVSKKSVARKLSSLKNFFDFLVQKGEISVNPAYILKSPKIGRFLPSVLSVKEFTKIRNIIFKNDFASKRDRTILEFLYSSGVRSEELLSIRDRDIDLKNREALVTGKGSKERVVFFSYEAQSSLLDYLPLKKTKFPEATFSFVNRFGTKLSSRFLRKLVNKYASLAGIEKEVTPHTFRHSFATLLMDQGVSLKIIQELLGHSSISSTQIYTHISREELKRSYDRYAIK